MNLPPMPQTRDEWRAELGALFRRAKQEHPELQPSERLALVTKWIKFREFVGGPVVLDDLQEEPKT